MTAMVDLTRCIDQRRRLRICVEYFKTCLIPRNFEQKEKTMGKTLLIRKDVRISLKLILVVQKCRKSIIDLC